MYALEREGIACRLLDHEAFQRHGLTALKALIIPGGYSFYMLEGVGHRGIAEIRNFVEQGGTYLGICAGSYFASKNVRWEKKDYPYPLGLFDGTTEGSLPGIAPWPRSAGVSLTIVDDRTEFQLPGVQPVYYKGGGRFIGGTDVKTIATYPDRTVAVVERRMGLGRVVLSGCHFERLTPDDDPNASHPPPDLAGKAYPSFLGLARTSHRIPLTKWQASEFRSAFTERTAIKEMLSRENKLRAELKDSSLCSD